MRGIRAFSAMLFVFCLLVIFLYSTLHLDTAHAVGATVGGTQEARNPPSRSGEAGTTAVERTPTTPEAFFQTITVSEDLRQMITNQEAYWNRLLHSTLRSLDRGGYSHRKDPLWSVCREDNRDHLQLNIHDFGSYPPLLQTFVEGMNCRSPPIRIDQPDKCLSAGRRGFSKTFLLFAIKSSPRNFEQRQAVRQTWGKEGSHGGLPPVRTVFLLGTTSPDDPPLDALLAFEAKHFGDLLQWDFHESFLNLTLKMEVSLRWLLRNCPGASFVFSGDDDVFVNTPGLLAYLQALDPAVAEHLYVGHVINTASPLRDPKSKYYIPSSFYDGAYPPYAGGGGFLFSGGLLQPLYAASRLLPFFPIDDVFFAMCAKALGVSPTAHSGFQTFDIQEKDRGNVCVHKHLMLVHQRSPQQTTRLWRGINSPMLTC